MASLTASTPAPKHASANSLTPSQEVPRKFLIGVNCFTVSLFLILLGEPSHLSNDVTAEFK